ncbi:Glycine--tRNA ligase beta subunit [Buchnera aphidicola (Cinara piceae)]|uniref:Glycine--tRNA ligase beta subunit n=1 Tax=Buchnera aphidicola (Cinara piceae) TaxID=1660043 RepID=A0A803FU94_9GAMM|nr:glycine--tRNA ligase subunit beta [Buchnera aphidicola]VFP87994.1 Glycine--tRNA ligase beta subunit [Buchnera aphidicola (Cinara piceae)]
MNQKILLIEIQTEDLPSKELKNIAKYFYYSFKKELNKNQIKYKSITLFYTSKKIALKIFSLSYIKKSKHIKKIGPLIDIAFDKYNKKTRILKSWLKSNKITIKQTEEIQINKKQYLTYISKNKSLSLQDILKKIIPNTIKKIPLKKSMLWKKNSIKFSRPIHNIIVLLDDRIINLNIPGINSKNISYGHFLMSPKEIVINHANQYTIELFKKKYILISYEERKKSIYNQIINLTKKINKSISINNKLLKEIAISTEWPTAYLGKFKKKYLKIPVEILVYTIEDSQKYFPLYDIKTNNITNYFILISNIETINSKQIIKENEQVLYSKLNNIDFFIKQDQKINFSNRLVLLKNISFQKKIGSMYDKTLRIKEISKYISKIINSNLVLIKKSAILSKCDLTTNIITECTALQGIIGMYYALQNKEKEEVALSIKEHYLPKFSQSNLPTKKISCVISIADKIDTITGIFSIGKIPTNNKDPFALRRAAIGIIRIIIEKKININLKKIIKKSINLYNHIKKKKTIQKLILQFIFSKYISLYAKKYDKNIILSVLSLKLVNLLDIDQRINILIQFKKNNDIENILNIYKRINNILSKKQDKLKIIKVNPFSLKCTEKFTQYEKKLIQSVQFIQKKIDQKNKINYLFLLQNIQKLCPLIEDFFKNSLIYDKNIKIRSYRIFILKKIKKIFLYITNFSYL